MPLPREYRRLCCIVLPMPCLCQLHSSQLQYDVWGYYGSALMLQLRRFSAIDAPYLSKSGRYRTSFASWRCDSCSVVDSVVFFVFSGHIELCGIWIQRGLTALQIVLIFWRRHFICMFVALLYILNMICWIEILILNSEAAYQYQVSRLFLFPGWHYF